MRTQGHAKAMISARNGVAPAASWGGTVPGTVASKFATQSLRRTFRGERGQVPLVRDFVTRYLDRCHCPADVAEDVLLCATELAANAVLHSRSGISGGYFSVQVAVRAGQSVRVTVGDSGGPWRERGSDDADAECGRGLHVVSALAEDMGIDGDASGRMAWFRCRWGTGMGERGE